MNEVKNIFLTFMRLKKLELCLYCDKLYTFHELCLSFSVPTADQALGQVALLQRELAELRAQQSGGTGQDLPGLDIDDEEFMDEETGEVKKSRGKIETALLKSNRIENAEALELSEKSYFNLTKSLARRMGLEKMNGNQTMAHISREEREKLFVEREKDIENINTNVNSLFSRVERKDELLNNYEKDLNKLREMENIASQKQKELLKSNVGFLLFVFNFSEVLIKVFHHSN